MLLFVSWSWMGTSWMGRRWFTDTSYRKVDEVDKHNDLHNIVA